MIVQPTDAPTLLLLNIITSNIRNCVRESSKVNALEPLRQIAKRLTADETIDRVVPYLVSLFKDESSQVRVASFELLVQLVSAKYMLTCVSSSLKSASFSFKIWKSSRLTKPASSPSIFFHTSDNWPKTRMSWSAALLRKAYRCSVTLA